MSAEREQRMAEIEARLASVVARPWSVAGGSDAKPGDPLALSVKSDDGYYVCEMSGFIDEDDDGTVHAAFIANAPTDIEWLLAELRAGTPS